MGLLVKDKSPEKVTVIGEVAMAPSINRTPVPEFPQSITFFGSANPPTPTPSTDQFPLSCLVTCAPKLLIASAVSKTSSPSRRPLISVHPIDSAPRIKERCDIDLSPGIIAVPDKGLPLKDLIDIKSF